MNTQTGLVTVFGYGPTGQATAERLLARGTPVRIVQRKRPENLPTGATFMACDVLNADDVKCALAGAQQAVITIGFEYSGKAWRSKWPRAMENFLAAAEAANVRIVHIDNMYMYGPQDEPVHEDMPLTSHGVKPSVRAQVTRMWQKAAREGRVRWAALRAPDFYGPGVMLSHLGATGLARVAQGKSAQLLMEPDIPHAFAYVPDIGRAAVTLLDAPDSAFNQAWHVPCAPTRTPRDLLRMGAEAAGVDLKLMSIPSWLLRVLGVFSGSMREYAEMRFTWNRPYHVNAAKFARRFWSDATPFDIGIPAAMRSYPAAEPKPSRKAGAAEKTTKSGGRTPAAAR
ncbi:MAG: NAD-dependent epimerase/dehydratase family protein [Hyphomonadaceae bacterium]